ncbi:hypothetical protein NMY22_g13535 [Coprinellus aureogranulatus]|nr:hypothetical protein NMY22_g13535 [Coprinellus aureogranulatus]
MCTDLSVNLILSHCPNPSHDVWRRRAAVPPNNEVAPDPPSSQWLPATSFRKHWKRDGSQGSLNVVPDEFKDFDQWTSVTIRDVLKAYGVAGLVACPDTLPSGDLAPPSSQAGTPEITEIVRIPELDAKLGTPPDELLEQEIPAKALKFFTFSMMSIRAAPGWAEDQMTASHHPIYHACISGLAEMADREAGADLNARTKDGLESDIRFVLFAPKDEPSMEATFCSEHKRPDSAFQGTFDKEPWQLRAGLMISWVAGWTAITKGLVESYSHRDVTPLGFIAFATFAVPPARLHFFGFDSANSLCAMSSNIVPLRGQGDSIDMLTDRNCWEGYYSRVLWVCFIWLVGCSNEFASKWENKFGAKGVTAVAKAREVNSLIGEACNPSMARWWALRILHVKQHLIHMMGRLLLAVAPTRLLLSSITQLHDESLHETITFDKRSMLSFGSLPLKNAKISANEKTTVFIYEDAGLVVKVYQKAAEQTFERELAAYEACAELQGEAIPWLYGSGRRRSDGKRVLVTSYAGKPVERLTPEIIDRVYTGPLHALKKKMHHHDIWEGNIVMHPDGRLMLIDLGSAVLNEECGEVLKCPDEHVHEQWETHLDDVLCE